MAFEEENCIFIIIISRPRPKFSVVGYVLCYEMQLSLTIGNSIYYTFEQRKVF